MQISQLEVDQWPAPLRRARSGCSRDSKKVSCETLSNVDWYSRRTLEAQLYYQSDGDDDAIPASDAEDDYCAVEEDAGYQEGSGCLGKLESHGYGEGLSAEGHRFLVCLSSNSAHTKPAIAMSSPGRNTKKAERRLCMYARPNLHAGSLPLQLGRILPHSGPIKLHVGSHANIHTTSKVSGSIRGSSFIIPSNVGGKLLKSSGSSEPSSPKVTCLGRVKIKTKYCREMGRLADMAVVVPNEKAHMSISGQMMELRRRMHRAHAVAEEAFHTEERQKASPKVAADMSGRGKLCSNGGKKASKHAPGSKMDLRKSRHGWGSRGEDTFMMDGPASDPDSKVQRGIEWRLKRTSACLRFRGDSLDKKKHSSDSLADNRHPSSQAAAWAIDLNRFCSFDAPCTQDKKLSTSLAGLLIANAQSQKIQQMDDMEFLPQVPPSNSLLLMRKCRAKGVASFPSSRTQGADSYDEQAILAMDR